MTADELIADLNERIDRGVAELDRMAENAQCRGDWRRMNQLRHKRQGLLVVKDWLRSYPQGDDQ